MLIPQTEIIINLDGAELARVVVEPGVYLIGTHPVADIIAQAEGVALYHAHLTVTPDEMRIQDLGSESGTYVSGVLATEALRIWPNQKVLIGPAVLEARRVRTSAIDQSLPAPAVAARKILPEEFLRGRKYEIAGTVGQGGMGAVLRAHEATTHRTVAMKVMLANISEADVVRFISEAQITSQLEHPNIVPVHELGVDEHDQVFYTMKLVQGVNLREILDKLKAGDADTCAQYPLRRLLVVLLRVCDAIAFAHSKGVIHRDLKPDNVMIGDFGEVLVMDWGLAKVLGTPEVPYEPAAAAMEKVVSSARSAQGDSFTHVGAFVGTPHYMSPEQARGETETLDARADVWALGAILRQILSLAAPVEGEDADEIMAKVRAGQLVTIPKEAPHCPGGWVPEALTAVAEKAQSVDREKRYATAAEFREEIDAYLGGYATQAERAGAFRQLWLLMNRHRAVSASLLVLLVVCVVFVVRLVASERRANVSADLARTNQQRAEEKEQLAHAAEARALADRKIAREQFARSQRALADAAFRESDSTAMLAALDAVPEDLRDSEWRYLRSRADNSQARVENENGNWYVGAAADPVHPGVFAVVAIGGELVMVEGSTGKRLRSFPLTPRQKHGNWHRGVDFSPDGERIAVGSMGDGGVAIYRVKDGECLAQWEGEGVDKVQFNETGDRLFTVDDQRGLVVHDAATGEVRGECKPCFRGAYAGGGKAIVSDGELLRVVDPVSHQVERELYRGRAWITSVSMPLGAKNVYFATRDGMIRGLNFADGTVMFEGRLADRNAWITAVSAGRYVIAGTGAGDQFREMRMWDTETGYQLPPLLGGVSAVEGLAIHPATGDVIVNGVDTRTWNVGTRPPQWTFDGAGQSGVFWGEEFIPGTSPVRLEADGQFKEPPYRWHTRTQNALVATAAGKVAAVARLRGPGPRSADIFVVRRTGQGVEIAQTFSYEYDVRALRLSPDGERLAVYNYYSSLIAWDTKTGQKLPACDLKGIHVIQDLRWVGTERLAAVVSIKPRGSPGWEERVVLWDVQTGRQMASVHSDTPMDCLAVSPDGKLLAEAGQDKYVRLRDAETLAVKDTFRAHDGPVTALAFHPSKPLLATASADRTVRLWNLANRTMEEEIRSPGKEPRALNFNTTGNLLACCDVTPSGFVWDLRIAQPEAQVQARRAVEARRQKEIADSTARRGLWAEARAAYEALVRLDPETSMRWFQLSPVLVQLGDHEAYRQHCHAMLERYGDTDEVMVMERTAKACLIEPIDEADRQRALRLAETAVVKGANHPSLVYFQFAKGLGQYRSGAFDAAAETLQAFGERPATGDLDLHARAVLAMANYRAGRTEEARTILKVAQEAASTVLPAEGTDQTGAWHDYLTARLLLREAAATLEEK